jgi:hypothetical protein
MFEDRVAGGTFKSEDLASNATSAEQSAAGVSINDSAEIADRKVMGRRLNESAQGAAQAHNGPADWNALGKLLRWTLLLAGALAVLLGAGMAYTRQLEPRLFQAHQLMTDAIQLSHAPAIFTPTTKLPEFLGWQELKGLRSRALHPERYEQDLCERTLGDASRIPSDLRIQTWKVNAKGWCVSDDADAALARAGSYNLRWSLIALAIAAAGTALLGWLAILLQRGSDNPS